jgi:hypothetical protein
MPRFVTNFAIVFMFFSPVVFGETLYQCTPEQAESDGLFKCLSNCDENHIAQGQFGPKKYCLSYFPDGGHCYMKPYERSDILNCNGEAGGSNPPMWFIFAGGSNMFMMFKTLLDELLDLPGNAGYNPRDYWNAPCKATQYAIRA